MLGPLTNRFHAAFLKGGGGGIVETAKYLGQTPT